MFTGIIQQVGCVESIERTQSGVRIVIDPRGWEHTPRPGESIANSGCCLTLVDPVEDHGGLLTFDAIPETLEKTTLGSWGAGHRVNLERALRMGDMLDGHQVQGHVDGTGSVLGVFTDDGWRVRVGLDEGLMRYMIPKGSITIDGVSLTLAAIDTNAGWVEVALIPETLDRTNLRDRAVGDRVNIECDVLVKTIVHTMARMNAGTGNSVH
jgi:riboflavin synthase